MATDHEITTLNLMSDVGILGIDTRNSFVNCYYSLSRQLSWEKRQNEDLNVPGSASLCFEQFRVLTAFLFLFLSFLFYAIYFSQSNFFISTFTYQRRTVFLKVEHMFSVSIQTNHCERENLEITPKIIVLLKIQCSKNFLGLTGPSIAF